MGVRAAVLIGLMCASVQAGAENWPSWRGPAFNGSSPEEGLPARWSTTQNVAWVARLPGKTAATPVVWGDSVFVPSGDAHNNLLLMCLSARDGSVRWQKQVVSSLDKLAAKNNMTGPSPVTDGKVVVSTFGTGDVAAFDFDGNQLWTRNLAREHGRFAIMFFYSSSPVLLNGKLYLQAVQRADPKVYTHAIDTKPTRESFVMCIDAATGADVWRVERATDAVGETQDAYTSPIPVETDRGTQIVVYGAGYVTSHDPATGKELWRVGSLNPERTGGWRTITSPVAGAGMVFACVPRNGQALVAVRANGDGAGDERIAWKLPKGTSDVCTPLYYRDRLFVLNGDKRTMTCVDPKTGDVKWQGSIGAMKETFTASPTGADGKVYCIGEAGTVVVVSATADEFKIESTFSMEGEGSESLRGKNGIPLPSETLETAPILSGIAVANGRLFIRTPLKLYCIGNK